MIWGGGCGWFIGIIGGGVFISIYSFIISIAISKLLVTGVVMCCCVVDNVDSVDYDYDTVTVY